jgi:head-tail adaptor
VGIAAGTMRHRVQVQQLKPASTDLAMRLPYNAQPSPADDASWQTTSVQWAGIKPLSGRELFQAQQVRADVTHRVWMRWFPGVSTFTVQPGIKPSMRLLFKNTRPLNIVYCANVDEYGVEFDILCIEEV